MTSSNISCSVDSIYNKLPLFLVFVHSYFGKVQSSFIHSFIHSFIDAGKVEMAHAGVLLYVTCTDEVLGRRTKN